MKLSLIHNYVCLKIEFGTREQSSYMSKLAEDLSVTSSMFFLAMEEGIVPFKFLVKASLNLNGRYFPA